MEVKGCDSTEREQSYPASAAACQALCCDHDPCALPPVLSAPWLHLRRHVLSPTEQSCFLWPPHGAEKAGGAFRVAASAHLCDSPFQSPLQGPDALALSVAGPLMCAQKMGPLGLLACPSRSRVLGDLAGVPPRAQGSRDLGSARPSCTAQSGP